MARKENDWDEQKRVSQTLGIEFVETADEQTPATDCESAD
jgi:hypothetical protein